MISTTAADHDSAGFMRGLGDAYRASGRRHSIVDTFARDPYPENAAVALVRSGRVDTRRSPVSTALRSRRKSHVCPGLGVR